MLLLFLLSCIFLLQDIPLFFNGDRVTKVCCTVVCHNVVFKNVFKAFEYKSALNKKKETKRGFVFFNDIYQFSLLLSHQIIRLLKIIDSICANWSMTFTVTGL